MRRGILEEKRGADTKRVGDALQSARADAVHAFLVFLYLLKGDAESIGEGGLAHAQDLAAATDQRTDVYVYRIGLLCVLCGIEHFSLLE
ncbi:hypothetical protein D3C80_1728210 [compost metagenome]